MIARAEFEALLAPFLVSVDLGSYRPQGPHLRDLIELKATFDSNFTFQRGELRVAGPVPSHPVLGPALQELLDALSQGLLKEPWSLRPGQTRSAGGMQLAWTTEAAGHLITLGRKKGLLGLFG